MLILSLRTDKPESEIGLFDDNQQLDYVVWQAHRQLAETIHIKLREMLEKNGKTTKDLEAVVCYLGPGSFTGLRIGLSVANAVAYGCQIPIVGEKEEDRWLERALKRALAGENDKVAKPHYGAPVHITVQKK